MRDRFFQLGDFKTVTIEGTTHATPNTQFWERYSLAQTPRAYLPLYGRFYVPKYGYRVDANGRGWVDVRSAESSEPFGMVLFFD